ncbi:MAG: DUF4097 family beta strand repeat protein, partial [Oscillospiraceae bacterium]|nr:DUF4097 family beta strand repeat protein [Oscillospiraceae bacterium]
SIDEKFSKINVNTDTAYISFELAKDGQCKVVCDEYAQNKHEVFVDNGTLIVKKPDGIREFISFGITTGHQNVTVYLPQKSYDKLILSSDTGKVKVPDYLTFDEAEVETDTGYIEFYADVKGNLSIGSDTGRITVQDVNPKNLDVSTCTGAIVLKNILVSGNITITTDTGDTDMTSVKCRGLEMRSDTGDITLAKVIASASANIGTDTGDVYLNGFDANEIFIRTNTGEVMGTILSEKIFFAESDTGDVDVPRTITGGKCEITTDTGDITIDIA